MIFVTLIIGLKQIRDRILIDAHLKTPLDKYKPLVYGYTMTPEQLKAWRKNNHYSQSQLAKVLGVATMTVSRWERGVREIPSFLHLTLECVEKGGGEEKGKGRRTRKGVKR